MMLRRRGGAGQRRRRGVGFVWFLLVGMPVLLFAVAMAADMSRLYVASRQAGLVAEASAVAGAFEQTPGHATIDPGRAYSAAMDTVVANRSAGAMSAGVMTGPAQVVSTSHSVTVTVNYRVDGLVVAQFFGATPHALAATRTADVCVPGAYLPTGGSCTRPTD